MKQKMIEQSVLFASILKWFFIASIVGILIGASTTLFLTVLSISKTYVSQWPYYFLLLPVAMFLSSLIVKYLAPDAEGHGTEQVIEAIHTKFGRINPLVVPIKLLATVITLSFGGSAGKEGPCAQIGAGLASLFCDLTRISDLDRTKLVICGISAGFASVFGTPIAGALFAVEVLAIGRIQYAVLFPCFVSAIMAYQTSSAFGIQYFHSPIRFTKPFSEVFFAEIIGVGILCGLCSFLVIECLNSAEKLSKRLHWWKPLKGLLGGSLVASTAFISPKYLGLGVEHMEAVLKGDVSSTWYDFLLKLYATVTTLAFGGSGGIITPIFFIGSTFGSFLAGLFQADPVNIASLCLVGILSGCTNTPIASSVLAMELFGTDISSYAAIVSVISFVLSGHRSVYPSQILSIQKSDSLKTNIGETIREIKPPEWERK